MLRPMLLLLLLALLVALATCNLPAELEEPEHVQFSDLCTAADSCIPVGVPNTPHQRRLPLALGSLEWLPSYWCNGAPNLSEGTCGTSQPTSSRLAHFSGATQSCYGVLKTSRGVVLDHDLMYLDVWRVPEVEERAFVPQIHVDRAVTIIGRYSANYFHFMLESLSRLMLVKPLLDADPSLQVLTHGPAFAVDALTELGYGSRLVLSGVTEDADYREQSDLVARELWVPSQVSMYEPQRELVQQLRDALRVRVLPVSARDTIVFMSRVGSSTRNVENEEELLARLRAQFPAEKFVVFDGLMSLRETVSLMERAKLVIGPHGAGLTNIMFAAPGTPMLELQFSIEPVSLFWRLADELRMPYWVVRSPLSYWRSNLTAPVDETLEVVQRILTKYDIAANVGAISAGNGGSRIGGIASCAAGHFATSSGVCAPCAPGFFSRDGTAAACTMCPSGTFASLSGSSACSSCPEAFSTWIATGVYEPSSRFEVFEAQGATSLLSCIAQPEPEYIHRLRSAEFATDPYGYNYGYAPPSSHHMPTVFGGLDGSVRIYTGRGESCTPQNDVFVYAGTLFAGVSNSETHIFYLVNTAPNSRFVVSASLFGDTAFSLVGDADNIAVPPNRRDDIPGTSRAFAIRYAPQVASSFDTAVVELGVTLYRSGVDGGAVRSQTLCFRVSGYTTTLPLTLVDDSYTMRWSETLEVPAGVLANDISLQGTLVLADTVVAIESVSPVTTVANLTVDYTLLTNGTLTFRAPPSYVGKFRFTYLATNGFAFSSAIVTIDVLPVLPNITCPLSFAVFAPIGSANSSVAWESANTSYPAISVVTQIGDPLPGSVLSALLPPYTITFLAYGLPNSGLLNETCSFTVTVLVRPPTISCASTATKLSSRCTFNASGIAGPLVEGYNTVITSLPSLPSIVNVGSSVIIYTVTDGFGQTASCNQSLVVTLIATEYNEDQLSGWLDADQDGFGRSSSACIDFATPASKNIPLASNNADCNDNNPRINPTIHEICNGLDDNCNGLIDEGLRCDLAKPPPTVPVALPVPVPAQPTPKPEPESVLTVVLLTSSSDLSDDPVFPSFSAAVAMQHAPLAAAAVAAIAVMIANV